MVTKAQIKKIHTLKNALKLDDELYREILSEYGATSSKNLAPNIAGELIEQLENMAVDSGNWVKAEKKFDGLLQRTEMATPKQLRMIESVWSQIMIAYAKEKEVQYVDKEKFVRKSLRKFLMSKFSVSDLRFLDSKTASKVIKAVLEIQKRYLK